MTKRKISLSNIKAAGNTKIIPSILSSKPPWPGRSEPVYSYQKTERDVSFTLKLFAQTALELDAIYGKLRRLTSLAYPEYQYDAQFANVDDNGNIIPTESKRRMKPPLMEFRLGE